MCGGMAECYSGEVESMRRVTAQLITDRQHRRFGWMMEFVKATGYVDLPLVCNT